MCLNTLAGRSYNDLMQYPVFPWIIADYDSEVSCAFIFSWCYAAWTTGSLIFYLVSFSFYLLFIGLQCKLYVVQDPHVIMQYVILLWNVRGFVCQNDAYTVTTCKLVSILCSTVMLQRIQLCLLFLNHCKGTLKVRNTFCDSSLLKVDLCKCINALKLILILVI